MRRKTALFRRRNAAFCGAHSKSLKACLKASMSITLIDVRAARRVALGAGEGGSDRASVELSHFSRATRGNISARLTEDGAGPPPDLERGQRTARQVALIYRRCSSQSRQLASHRDRAQPWRTPSSGAPAASA